MPKPPKPTDLLFEDDAGGPNKYPQPTQKSLRLASMNGEDEESVALTKYSHDFPETLIRMASSGYSARAFCAQVNISYATFRHWQDSIPEFRDAAKIADMKRHLFYEHTGIKNLENRNFNCALFDRLTKSIIKWRDDQEVIHTHTHTVKPPDQMTARERKERIEQLQQQLVQVN
jgi:hypothetical protein